MDRVAALSTCKALLDHAVAVPNGVAGMSHGVELTIRLAEGGWEMSTVIRTHGHAFLVVADEGRAHVGYRWLDGRSYRTASTPPALIETVLKAAHQPPDTTLVDRWEHLALQRLEAKDDVLVARFSYNYLGLDRELLQDGLHVMSRLRGALGEAIGAIPEREIALPEAADGPYRSATVRTPQEEALPIDYQKAVRTLSRKANRLSTAQALVLIYFMVLVAVAISLWGAP